LAKRSPKANVSSMRRYIYSGLFVAILILLYFVRAKEFKRSAFYMDTLWEVKIVSHVYPKHAFNRVFAVIAHIDSIANVFGNGELAKINSGHRMQVSSALREMLEVGIKMGKLSNGAFDVTIYPVMKCWHFFNDRYVPTDSEISAALQKVDYRKIGFRHDTLILPEGYGIDLGGLAKGYAVESAIKVLKDMGVRKALVNGGGEIGVIGSWKIGIRHPREQDETIDTFTLVNAYVATSGDYERYFVKNGKYYHHILDPKTGLPAMELVSVTVIDTSGVWADAIATAVFVLGQEKGQKLLQQLGITRYWIYTREEFQNSEATK